MLVAKEHRERLSHFCTITKQTQEAAANKAIAQMLDRLERDPEMKQRMDRVAELRNLIRGC